MAAESEKWEGLSFVVAPAEPMAGFDQARIVIPVFDDPVAGSITEEGRAQVAMPLHEDVSAV